MPEASPPVGRATPPAGATLTRRRPVRVVLVPTTRSGFDPVDPYVRRWWTCVLGPTAVTDLLRLVRAAERGETIPRPVGLPRLVAAGLAHRRDDVVVIPLPVPPVARPHLDRIPHALRARHQRDLERSRRP